MTETTNAKQLLHLVLGGELKSLDSVEFKDLDKLDIVGVFPNYATAYAVCSNRPNGWGRRGARCYPRRRASAVFGS